MIATESRSSTDFSLLQEVLDAGKNTDGSLEAYNTPRELANDLMQYLPNVCPGTAIDPQCGHANLLNALGIYGNKYGIELDDKQQPGGIALLTANCVKVWEAIDDLMPSLRFVCSLANPPFGRKWKLADGSHADSTEATWKFCTTRSNYGIFISNANTIEKLGLHLPTDKIIIRHYDRRQALRYWANMRPELEIGCLVWELKAKPEPSYYGTINELWGNLKGILDEERTRRPAFNIYLDREGFLRTYLSQRNLFKMKLTPQQVARLLRLNNAHPLSLVAEKETRELMQEFVNCGLYAIQPEARAAITEAIAQVNTAACPIMPPNSFALVAYAEEEEKLKCIKTVKHLVKDDPHAPVYLQLTAGRSYPISTHSYQFEERYIRKKVHFDEETQETYTAEHDCKLSGTDRYIKITADCGRVFHFKDRPDKDKVWDVPESLLWEFFERPNVVTVAEAFPEAVHTNQSVLKAISMLASYVYYEGQREYLARVAVKDAAVIAAATGAGKTLMAISIIAVKSPRRALIIAPQGTMRASEVDDDEEGEDDEPSMSASQWVNELSKFAPYLQVWEIFSLEDYERILMMNNGQLPDGVFITYFEAFFSNGALETAPKSWNDESYNKWSLANGLPPLPEGDTKYANVETIGHEVNGVRCILKPCLSTLIGHEFDAVLVDESHRFKSLESNLGQMLIRLQPKYRYCFTATPVANTVIDLFVPMGWVAVPDWYKGNRRNAAWPYAREDLGRFETTFLTKERDLTQEDENRRANPKWRGKCEKPSPIISSPARLLKLIQPNMAFISKEQCNAGYIPPKIIDVRVPLGREQALLYGHFTDRANIPASNPLVRARKQTAWLRSICADPAGFRHRTQNAPKCYSNYNPKVVAILELVRDILGRGEQVVIINSRVGLTDTIARRLTEAGVTHARIDSTISAEQQAYQANLFKQKKVPVIFMGIKSAAGYSFDDADNLIVGSLEFASGHLTQATGRIDRVTNKRVKNIYCILHKDTIEEMMFDLVSVKSGAADLCLRGQRVPREFKPVDPGEVLAHAIDKFNVDGSLPESKCEQGWPELCRKIRDARRF